ncbi:hypothetical protein HMI54_003846 [Coelomomyces lativittatus]|nr:hypothetical protein HMI54_003846 [Coelomomyces lativittatus]
MEYYFKNEPSIPSEPSLFNATSENLPSKESEQLVSHFLLLPTSIIPTQTSDPLSERDIEDFLASIKQHNFALFSAFSSISNSFSLKLAQLAASIYLSLKTSNFNHSLFLR